MVVGVVAQEMAETAMRKPEVVPPHEPSALSDYLQARAIAERLQHPLRQHADVSERTRLSFASIAVDVSGLHYVPALQQIECIWKGDEHVASRRQHASKLAEH